LSAPRGAWSTAAVLARPLILGALALGCVACGQSAQASPSDPAPLSAQALTTAAPSASAALPEAAPPVRLAFAGDLAMAITVGLHLESLAQGKRVPPGVGEGYPFAAVKERIAAADLAIGNLECVVSAKGASNSPFHTFRAPAQAIPAIVAAGFDVVSIANNHALDFGDDALRDMRARLDRGGLPYLGRGTRSNDPEEPLIREIRGLKIGLYGFYDVPYGVAYAMVRKARPQVDVLIVFNHWGREDHPQPIPTQRRLGHGLIDAGADIVVGTHAHVVQPEEWYRGKLIFYGLGNFVFAGMGYDELHRTGAFLELDLDRTGLRERRVYRVRIDDDGAPRWLDSQPWTPVRVE
jgi:poly-gamma-glutamate synthesis protein (capsule biosynthesis protein)